jgi:hypothetical protein
MKTILPCILGAFVAVGLSADARAGESTDLRDLVHRADYALRGQTTAAVVKMTVHTATFERAYDMVYWDDERAGHSRVLVKILGPALWRGHGTLKVDQRLTMYNPSADRMTVLSGSMLGESWMGSHFSNDDLVKETDLAADYEARELRAWDAQGATGHTVRFHRVELHPTPRAPVPWDRIALEAYVDGALVVPTRLEYFRRAGDAAPYRALAYSDVKPIGGRTAPTTLTMTVTDKPGEFTRLVYENAKFDVNVPDAKFTEQALRQ